MSNKINVCSVIAGHLSTYNDAQSGKISLGDIFTFFITPIIISIIGVALQVDFSDKVIEVFVNSSAIFTGLLLNLLVLVYDQKTKLPTVNVNDVGWETNQSKHTLIQELYYNISYSTLTSVLILILSVMHLCLDSIKTPQISLKHLQLSTFDVTTISTTPLLIFCSINLVLTILMIIKRIYSLLSNSK